MEVGTLKELGVEVGDVVEYVSGSPTHDYRLGDRYTCTIKDGELIVRYERGWFSSVEEDSWLYRIITRAKDKPKLWRDMTPEEKGALLLAAHDGKVIEWYNPATFIALYWEEHEYEFGFRDHIAYRIKPQPKVETVTLTWHGKDIMGNQITDDHRIIFQTIDGKPDCASIKMEEI